MNACSIDTSRIAFGVGDAMLRLWNLSEPHTMTFDVVIHWQKIKGKIRVVSWFPEDESTVAFDTGEGPLVCLMQLELTNNLYYTGSIIEIPFTNSNGLNLNQNIFCSLVQKEN